MTADDRPATCPAWCRADHEMDMWRRRESAHAIARSLAAEGLHRPPMIETYRRHSAEVGRAGFDEDPAELTVLVDQVEDYTLSEAA